MKIKKNIIISFAFLAIILTFLFGLLVKEKNDKKDFYLKDMTVEEMTINLI